MADSLQRLSFSLGLNLSQLQADFIKAGKTVNQNLAALSRGRNAIKLRTELDVTGLDPIKDKTKILEIQEKGLNEQLAFTQLRLQLLRKEYEATATAGDKNSAAAQRQERAYITEQIAAKKLEQELGRLRQEREKTNAQSQASTKPSIKDVLGGALNSITSLDPRIASIVGQFQNLSSIASTVSSNFSRISGSLGTLGAGNAALPLAGLAAIPAGLAAFTAAGIKLQETLLGIAKPAITAGNSMYVLSRRMATTTAEAANFNTVCKAMGADTSTVLSALERLSKQWLTAGKDGNAVVRALKAFGVSLTNNDGRLKSHTEMMLALSEGFQKAKAAGQQAELQMMLFRNGMGDVVTAIEDFASTQKYVKEHVVKSKLGNSTWAHELQRQINALNIQTGQLSRSFSQAFMPLAAQVIPKLTEAFAQLMTIVNDNKDLIAGIVGIITEATGAIGNGVNNILRSTNDASKSFSDLREDWRKTKNSWAMDVAKDESIKTEEDFINARMNLHEKLTQGNNQIYGNMREYLMKDDIEAWENAKSALMDDADSYQILPSDYNVKHNRLFKTEEELAQYERLTERRKELEEIRYKASHNTVENQIYDIERIKQKQLEEAQTEEEKAAIIELAEEKISQVRKKTAEEVEQRIKALKRETLALSDNSAYQHQIDTIQDWKDAMLEKAETAEEVAAIEENAAAKAAKAYEDEVERIKNATQSFLDKIYELSHSETENQLYRLAKEIDKGRKEGVDESVLKEYEKLKQQKIFDDAREHEDRISSRKSRSTGRDSNLGITSREPKYIIEFDKSAQSTGGYISILGDQIVGAGTQIENFENNIQQNVDKQKKLTRAIGDETSARYHGLQAAKAYTREMEHSALSASRYADEMENEVRISYDRVVDLSQIKQIGEREGEAPSSKDPVQANEWRNTQLQELIKALSNGGLVRYGSSLYSYNSEFDGGRNALWTFNTQAKAAGMSDDEQQQILNDAYAKSREIATAMNSLDGIYGKTERLAKSMSSVSDKILNLDLTAHTQQVTQPERQNATNINVNPTINVDLGGAYVFDNKMKTELTEDITGKVATNVSAAVKQAVSQTDFGYAS